MRKLLEMGGAWMKNDGKRTEHGGKWWAMMNHDEENDENDEENDEENEENDVKRWNMMETCWKLMEKMVLSMLRKDIYLSML